MCEFNVTNARICWPLQAPFGSLTRQGAIINMFLLSFSSSSFFFSFFFRLRAHDQRVDYSGAYKVGSVAYCLQMSVGILGTS